VDPTIVEVAKLTRNVTRQHLVEIFTEFGEVKDALLRYDPMANISLCSAQVQFATHDMAKKAVADMDNGQIDGVRVSVLLSKAKRLDKPLRAPPGGAGGGGGVPRGPPGGRPPMPMGAPYYARAYEPRVGGGGGGGAPPPPFNAPYRGAPVPFAPPGARSAPYDRRDYARRRSPR
jgi:RNA-binding protein with serine-rich domain 1